MVDISEFTGKAALRANLIKKRDKAQEKLTALITKAQTKIEPLQAQLDKINALLQALDEAGKPSVNPSTGMPSADTYTKAESLKIADFVPFDENNPEHVAAAAQVDDEEE